MSQKIISYRPMPSETGRITLSSSGQGGITMGEALIVDRPQKTVEPSVNPLPLSHSKIVRVMNRIEEALDGLEDEERTKVYGILRDLV